MFLREFTNGVCVGWQDVDTVSIRRQLHPARYYVVSLVTLDFRMVLSRYASVEHAAVAHHAGAAETHAIFRNQVTCESLRGLTRAPGLSSR
jgi:hypothetical protein